MQVLATTCLVPLKKSCKECKSPCNWTCSCLEPSPTLLSSKSSVCGGALEFRVRKTWVQTRAPQRPEYMPPEGWFSLWSLGLHLENGMTMPLSKEHLLHSLNEWCDYTPSGVNSNHTPFSKRPVGALKISLPIPTQTPSRLHRFYCYLRVLCVCSFSATRPAVLRPSVISEPGGNTLPHKGQQMMGLRFSL